MALLFQIFFVRAGDQLLLLSRFSSGSRTCLISQILLTLLKQMAITFLSRLVKSDGPQQRYCLPKTLLSFEVQMANHVCNILFGFAGSYRI